MWVTISLTKLCERMCINAVMNVSLFQNTQDSPGKKVMRILYCHVADSTLWHNKFIHLQMKLAHSYLIVVRRRVNPVCLCANTTVSLFIAERR